MKLPTLTVRSMMIAVAVVAVALALVGMGQRRAERLHRAWIHRVSARFHSGSVSHVLRNSDRVEYHLGLTSKYERAADRPWIAVAPDPPEPR